VLKVEEVPYGGAATAPTPEELDLDEGYYITWDVDFSYITGDLVVTGTYHIDIVIDDPGPSGDAPLPQELVEEFFLDWGLVKGQGGGNIAYESELARSEALVFVLRLLGLEEEAQAWTGTHPFTDVPAGNWFYNYVGYAYENGLTSGTSATTYSPSAKVTYRTFVTLLLRAIGYTDSGDNADFHYTTAVDFADSIGLLDVFGSYDIDVEVNANITRADAIVLIARALVIPINGGNGETLLDNLVAKGVITQDQADDFLAYQAEYDAPVEP